MVTLTTGQLRALRQVASQRPDTPPLERADKHTQSRQYIGELLEMGLVMRCEIRGHPRIDLTPQAVDVLGAYWRGEMRTEPIVKACKEEA